MLYDDLGCVPLSISIKKRVIGYWYDIINSDNKLSSILYRLILQEMSIMVSYQWLMFGKTIFNDSGLTYIWQFFNGSKPMFLSRIETTLLSQFRQKWQSDVSKWFYHKFIKLIISLKNILIL